MRDLGVRERRSNTCIIGVSEADNQNSEIKQIDIEEFNGMSPALSEEYLNIHTTRSSGCQGKSTQIGQP